MTPGLTTALSNYYPSHFGLKKLYKIAFNSRRKSVAF